MRIFPYLLLNMYLILLNFRKLTETESIRQDGMFLFFENDTIYVETGQQNPAECTYDFNSSNMDRNYFGGVRLNRH